MTPPGWAFCGRAPAHGLEGGRATAGILDKASLSTRHFGSAHAGTLAILVSIAKCPTRTLLWASGPWAPQVAAAAAFGGRFHSRGACGIAVLPCWVWRILPEFALISNTALFGYRWSWQSIWVWSSETTRSGRNYGQNSMIWRWGCSREQHAALVTCHCRPCSVKKPIYVQACKRSTTKADGRHPESVDPDVAGRQWLTSPFHIISCIFPVKQ
jgi:hypothetical protein